MKKSENKIHVFLKASVSSALLFSLALLLLIVSCPLKRLLKDNFSATTTSATGSNRAHRNHEIANYSKVVNSCEVSEKPVYTTDFSQQVKLQTPQYFQNIINQPGYNTHSFLSRINYNYHSPESLNSFLPLFLQHLRLLI